MENSYLHKLQKKRIATDRRVSSLITLGGWLILVTLLLLVWHLLSVTMPLLGQPNIKQEGRWQLPENIELLATGDIRQQEFALWREHNCGLKIVRFQGDAWEVLRRIPKSCRDNIKVQTENGRFFIAELLDDSRFRIYYSEPFYDRSDVFPVMSGRLPFDTATVANNWRFVALKDTFLLIADDANGSKYVAAYGRKNFSLLYHYRLQADSPVAVLAPTNDLLAYEQGQFLRLGSQREVLQLDTAQAPSQVKDILPLPGGHAFLTQDSNGFISKWGIKHTENSQQLMRLYRTLIPQTTEHVALMGNNQLALLFFKEQVGFFNTTTGEMVGTESLNRSDTAQLMVKEGIISVYGGRILNQLSVENSTAITTFKSLWQEIWYEGYAQPDYVWQTSSALDSHQAKFSVVPLFIGSLKAALLAVLVAVPVGIGCAIYVGYFARQRVRRVLKPTIELIEGIPSVVIGFIAAIWLLPIAEKYLLGLFLFILLCPVFLGLFCLFRVKIGNRWRRGWEMLFVVVTVALYLLVFDGILANQQGFISWFWSESALAGEVIYGSAKNTMILALALGFAIAPTVFSIAEDAINEVPTGLLLASFAMGADQVQTLQRIVLVAALPGILSAVMLGFARALGETMIVLMVSGNTPIADWDLWQGIRTLTANLAIELPEAQVGGVHYQVLFLTALLLFSFTFVVNTFAELLRQKLRRHYHG